MTEEFKQKGYGLNTTFTQQVILRLDAGDAAKDFIPSDNYA